MKKNFYLIILFFAGFLYQQVAAQVKLPKEIKRGTPPALQTKGQSLVRSYDNIISGAFGLNQVVPGGTAKEKAFNFLKNNWQQFGLAERPEIALRFLAEKQLATTTVVRFKQLYSGLPVDRNEITVTIDGDQKIVAFLNNSIPVKSLASVAPRVSKTTAEQKVMQYLLHPERVQLARTELMVHIIDFKPFLAYRTIVVADNPNGEWEAFIDANTGEILSVENIATEINGTGLVFDCDPVTSAQSAYGTGSFIDNSDANSTALTDQLVSVTLQDITFSGGVYKLAGPYAVISDFESPLSGLFTQATSNFSYNRSQLPFEATMCYYHIDKSMRYINTTLGITVMPQQYSGGVQYDPHGLSGGINAHYISSTGRIAFGSPTGNTDAAEDAGVVLHELGHGIHDWLMAGTGVSQVEGLSEGCGDYWAKSYERSLGFWDNPGEWGYNHVFFWGLEPAFPGRSCNTFFSYPGGMPWEVHDAGQMWCSTLMRIWADIGKTKTDRMFLVGLGMTNTGTNQAQAAAALYQAAVSLGYTNAELCIIYHHFQTSYGTYFTSLVTAPSSGADIYIQDTPNDTGVESNPDTGPMWVSNDIWVRRHNDGGLLHENPEYTNPMFNDPNYIYVRVHGRGCTTITNAELHVYFSKASTGLQWSSNWINYTITQFGLPVLAGDEITTVPVTIPPLAAGEEIILAIPWFPPNPADFETEIHHFCLLARIVTASDPMFIAETNDVNGNTKNNNNIAWKNVSVFDNNTSDIFGPAVFVRNNGKDVTTNEITITQAVTPANPLFNKNGDVIITLNSKLYDLWVAGGRVGANFKEMEKGQFKVLNGKFYLGGLKLLPGASYVVNVKFKPYKNAKNCWFDLTQNNTSTKRKVVVGGERFEYQTGLVAKDPGNPGGGPGIFDEKYGNGITGNKPIAASNGILKVSPNPATSTVVVSAKNFTDVAAVAIYNRLGNKVMEINANAALVTDAGMRINLSALQPGLYFIHLRDSKGVTVAYQKLTKM